MSLIYNAVRKVRTGFKRLTRVFRYWRGKICHKMRKIYRPRKVAIEHDEGIVQISFIIVDISLRVTKKRGSFIIDLTEQETCLSYKAFRSACYKLCLDSRQPSTVGTFTISKCLILIFVIYQDKINLGCCQCFFSR